VISVSIIIPTLNEESYIEKTLKSLREQIESGDEILIVDSYSVDDTVKISKEYGANIHYIPRCGIGPAKTFGAEKALNDVLAFLDADAVPDKHWLPRIRENLTDISVDAIGGVDLYSSKSLVNETLYNFYSILVFFTGVLYYKLTGYPWMPWNNCAIKKDAFIQKGGLRNVVCEDYDFALRAKGIKVIYDNKMIVTLSDRRFRKEGFLKTLWLWVKSDYALLRNKNLIESTSYEVVR
jgi:glycosyltransferase involved in cell wall biosynthesis